MQRRDLLTLAVAGLLLVGAAGPVAAQGSINVSADVPFEFAVGSKTMPAGKYSVTNRTNTGVLSVQSEDARNAANVIGISAQSNRLPETGKLVFNKYGDRYFLSQVWTLGSAWGLEIPKHRAERELARMAANRERVTVLAKR